ncbi:DUF6299 family protein [Micromonospora sp. CPCC 206060]|uniref:DUF6299 family protein n=1 Tax=Micromonospora sp. CPCC 206060 TaxID=3122406 RepID=UPI002FF239DB
MRSVGRLGSLVLAVCLATAGLLGVPPAAAAAAARPRPITVNPFGTVDVRAATATIGGTYRCGTERGLAYIEVHLSQRVRRVPLVTGFGFGVIPACTDGTTAGRWQATIPADEGAFRSGSATALARLVVEPNTLVETTEPVRLVACTGSPAVRDDR